MKTALNIEAYAEFLASSGVLAAAFDAADSAGQAATTAGYGSSARAAGRVTWR